MDQQRSLLSSAGSSKRMFIFPPFYESPIGSQYFGLEPEEQSCPELRHELAVSVADCPHRNSHDCGQEDIRSVRCGPCTHTWDGKYFLAEPTSHGQEHNVVSFLLSLWQCQDKVHGYSVKWYRRRSDWPQDPFGVCLLV